MFCTELLKYWSCHNKVTTETWNLCRYEYRWADGVQIKKPIEVSAPKYVEYLMDWIEGQLDDESIFPQKLGNHCLSQTFDVGMVMCTLEIVQALLIYLSNFDTTHDTDMGLIPLPGTPFPPNFKEVVKTIFKRLFRVYAHIYHSSFQKIVSLKEEAHLNTCFKHFILFTTVSLFCL